jgi:hypothetical protein
MEQNLKRQPAEHKQSSASATCGYVLVPIELIGMNGQSISQKHSSFKIFTCHAFIAPIRSTHQNRAHRFKQVRKTTHQDRESG